MTINVTTKSLLNNFVHNLINDHKQQQTFYNFEGCLGGNKIFIYF